MNDPVTELLHTAEVLKQDTKNYHVWAHRQWVLSTYPDLVRLCVFLFLNSVSNPIPEAFVQAYMALVKKNQMLPRPP